MKTSIAENFMRPANDPVMRAPVKTANVIWKIMKRRVGMEPDIVCRLSPLRKM